MTDAKASHEMATAGGAWPLGARLLAGLAAAVALAAVLALWARYGEGVYAQMLLNAVIACF